jgi:predicted outer membrane repeat protein
MYNSSSSPTLTNCTFIANTAKFRGGGMYNDTSSSSPTLTGCTFNSNTANSYGGGVYCSSSSSLTLTDCTFTANSASSGGALYHYLTSSLTLANCTFTANSASSSGGGIYNDSSSPKLTNCTFTANSASSSGGGMYNDFSFPKLTSCTFTANSASPSGGGIYNDSSSPNLTNCTFAANSSSTSGGAVYNYSSSPKLTNCTFTTNSAVAGSVIYCSSTSSSPTLTNCVLWDNSISGGQVSGGTPVVTYCDIQGGYAGTGNINAAPQFVHAPNPGLDDTWGTEDDSTDLRLRLNSPCIDAGSNDAVPSTVLVDRLGNPRKDDIPAIVDTGSGTAPLVDLGAYEAVAQVQVLTGGPYAVMEGKTTLLSGVAYSPQGLGLSYAWDLDADGQFDDASEPSPVFSAAGMQGPQTLAIALRVTDTSGNSTTENTVIRVVHPLFVGRHGGRLERRDHLAGRLCEPSIGVGDCRGGPVDLRGPGHLQTDFGHGSHGELRFKERRVDSWRLRGRRGGGPECQGRGPLPDRSFRRHRDGG